MADQIIVGSLINFTELGYYSQSLKVPKMSLAFINSLSIVLMPTIANLYEKNNISSIEKYLKSSLEITICIGVFGASSMAAVSSKFIPIFFGEKFEVIVQYMMIISLIAIIIPIGLVFTNQFIIPTSKNKEYVIPIISAALVSLICNITFIPIIGVSAAIITVILSEFTSTSLKIFLVRKYLNIKEIFNGSYIYFLFGIVNFLLVVLILSLFKTNIFSLLLGCILCFLFYGSQLIIFNNPIRSMIYEFYSRLRLKRINEK